MLKRLTEDQVGQYRHDGFLSPVPALTAKEASRYRAALEAHESALGMPLTDAPPMQARKLHVRFPWAAELVRHPSVLDSVEDLIGPDILVYNATFFIKEAGTGGITAWHQDSTYFGLEPQAHVTAWIALSDTSRASGCMDFIPGSSAWGQLHHAAETVPESINFGGQTVVAEIDDDGAVAAPLALGQLSFHHTRVLHRSGPNKSEDRRIGFGISYIPASVRHTGTRRPPASLVRGRDRFGHFNLEPDPRELGPAQAEAAHDAAYAAYRVGYMEQMERHAAKFAPPAS